jgi:hypothetical protein
MVRDKPVVFSQGTDWQGRQMWRILDFLALQGHTMPAFNEEASVHMLTNFNNYTAQKENKQMSRIREAFY